MNSMTSKTTVIRGFVQGVEVRAEFDDPAIAIQFIKDNRLMDYERSKDLCRAPKAENQETKP